MSTKPIGNRILIKPNETPKAADDAVETATAIPTDTGKGTVVAVGDGVTREFKSGDVVIFTKYSCDDVEINGETFKIINVDDVIAIEV